MILFENNQRIHESRDASSNYENVDERSDEDRDSSPRKPIESNFNCEFSCKSFNIDLKQSYEPETKPTSKASATLQKPVEEMHDDHMRMFNVNEPNEGFPKNYISTTKYNIITFFPLCLLKQFARIANIYFLIIAIMACVPQISTFTPYTAIFPLVFVLLVSIFREGVEDFYRYKSDRASNSKKVQRLGSEGTFDTVCSKDLEVGDIIYVEGEDTFAADVILLKSSNEINAFIQTSSLDGEKNLKKRFVPKGLETLTKPVSEKAYVLGGRWITLPPDKDLKSFIGTIKIGKEIFPLSIQQLLLKDSKLKNTAWIIGAVVYTGKHTKVMMNSQKARIKISNLERKLNVLIIILFFVQIFICFLLSMITLIYDKVQSNGDQSGYLGSNYKTYQNLNFFSYFLLLSTLIPISLIVTLEVIKTVQCYFISQDAEMYEVEADKGAKVSTTTINEELGQVTYVFSDKTGTLTQNIMEFKALAVGEEIYGNIGDSISRKPTRVELRKEVESNYEGEKLSKLLSSKSSKGDTPHEIKSSNGKSKFILKTEKQKVQEVIKLLSICHDCEAETAVVDGKKIMFYQGESPDEVTLVDFARMQGFEFLEANEARSIIKLYPRSGMITIKI